MQLLRATRASLFVVASLSSLSACAGVGQGTLPHQFVAPSLLRAAETDNSQQLFYISSQAIPPGWISEFTLSGHQVRRITGSIHFPGTIHFDGHGTLYVLNNGYYPSITEYAFGDTRVLREITQGIRYPLDMGVDAAGDVWVLDNRGPLIKYKPGARTPELATYKGLCTGGINLGPQTLAADRYGTAYVGVTCGNPSGNSRAFVREYDRSRSPIRSISIPSQEQPVSLATDSTGRLYLSFWDTSKSGRVGIAEYDRGATKPVLTFDLSPGASYAGGEMSFDASGDLYVSYGGCQGSGSKWTCASFVGEYKRGASKPTRYVSASPSSDFGNAAIDRDRNIYVESDSLHSKSGTRVLIFAPTSDKGKLFLSGHKLGAMLIYP